MIKARGPIWHKKQKAQGIIPKGLRGLDQEATWGKSQADGWVYGHGSFCLTCYTTPVVGLFKWRPNSAHEGKRLGEEMPPFEGLVKKVFMDSKADDQQLYFDLKQQYQMPLVTSPRKGMDKSASRQQMIQQMRTPTNVRDDRKRSTTVEPMQGRMKEIFDLDTCWMRGDANNRWLFAAMGIAVQMAQWKTVKQNASTWKVKQEVLGV